jgi:hypothetical protein
MHNVFRGEGVAEGGAQGDKLNHITEKVTSMYEANAKVCVQERVDDFQFRSLDGFRFGRHDDGNRHLGRRSVEVPFEVACRKKSCYLCF